VPSGGAADFAVHAEIEVGGDAAVAGAGGETGVRLAGKAHGDAAVAGAGANRAGGAGREREVDIAVGARDAHGIARALDAGMILLLDVVASSAP